MKMLGEHWLWQIDPDLRQIANTELRYTHAYNPMQWWKIVLRNNTTSYRPGKIAEPRWPWTRWPGAPTRWTNDPVSHFQLRYRARERSV